MSTNIPTPPQPWTPLELPNDNSGPLLAVDLESFLEEPLARGASNDACASYLLQLLQSTAKLSPPKRPLLFLYYLHADTLEGYHALTDFLERHRIPFEPPDTRWTDYPDHYYRVRCFIPPGAIILTSRTPSGQLLRHLQIQLPTPPATLLEDILNSSSFPDGPDETAQNNKDDTDT